MPKGYGRPATKEQKASAKKESVVKKMDTAMKYRQSKAAFEKDILAPAIKEGRIKQGVRNPNTTVLPEFRKGGMVKK